MHIPDKIYHATTWDKATQIMCSALIPHLEGTYFADTPAGSAIFLVIRGVPVKDIVVIEIDTNLIDKTLLREGTDHNPTFFKDIQVFIYPDEIENSCITSFYTFDTLEKEECCNDN